MKRTPMPASPDGHKTIRAPSLAGRFRAVANAVGASWRDTPTELVFGQQVGIRREQLNYENIGKGHRLHNKSF